LNRFDVPGALEEICDESVATRRCTRLHLKDLPDRVRERDRYQPAY
jgi:hypothetical protein